MIIAKRFDGILREFSDVSEAVQWARSDGLREWMQDGDWIEHMGVPGKCGMLRVMNSEGIETDASIQWVVHRK